MRYGERKTVLRDAQCRMSYDDIAWMCDLGAILSDRALWVYHDGQWCGVLRRRQAAETTVARLVDTIYSRVSDAIKAYDTL